MCYAKNKQLLHPATRFKFFFRALQGLFCCFLPVCKKGNACPWYVICAHAFPKNNLMDKRLVDKRDISATEERHIINNIFAVAPGVWRMKDVFVNVYIIESQERPGWVVVDTGLKSSHAKIKNMIAEVMEPGAVPQAIILTHGHFDHRGALQQLAAEWRVPVYCHHMELPYLTGKASYPPPDPTVGGGVMASMAFVYPSGPIDVQEYLRELPEDGTVPHLPDWRYVHTPGHTPGHISLFREKDGVLIAGDAVVTTKQESIFSVMSQKRVLSGPPKYFTPDWGAAARSVKALAALEPNVIATGHGHAMYGDPARKALHKMAREFWHLGMPERGRYVKEPALFDEDGPTYVPPKLANYLLLKVLAVATLAVAGYLMYKKSRKKGLL
jgi:glyoxylase-like metal-dependent hydrolase (beta-lactamase superfamily II)